MSEVAAVETTMPSPPPQQQRLARLGKAPLGGRVLSVSAIKTITARSTARASLSMQPIGGSAQRWSVATTTTTSPSTSPDASPAAPRFRAVLQRPSLEGFSSSPSDMDSPPMTSDSSGSSSDSAEWDDIVDESDQYSDDGEGSTVAPSDTGSAIIQTATREEFTVEVQRLVATRRPTLQLVAPAPRQRGPFIVTNATSPISPKTPREELDTQLEAPARPAAPRRRHSRTPQVPVGGSPSRRRSFVSALPPQRRPTTPDTRFKTRRKPCPVMTPAEVQQLVRVPTRPSVTPNTTFRQVLATTERRAAVYELVDEGEADVWRSQLRELKSPSRTTPLSSVKRFLRMRTKP